MLTIDSVVLYIITFILVSVEECPWDFTFFQKIIIAAIVVVMFHFFSKIKVVGGIILLGFSVLVTWFISILIPLMKWVNDSKIWYNVVLFALFVLFVLLHKEPILKSFGISAYNFHMFKKGMKAKLSDWKSKKSGTSKEGEYWKDRSQAQGAKEKAGAEEPKTMTSFFAGCSSEEDIKKRLRTLTKTFHPDNSEGDEETYKQILSEYENLKRQYGIQTQ